jgi:serine/threonine-protein kinase RsbW
MAHTERFSIGLHRSDISEFSDRFERWCEQHAVPADTMTAFQIAFDELLTNVIDYGLAGRSDGLLEVRLTREDDGVAAELVDDGPAFDPLTGIAAPDLDLDIEQREVGGLGLHLVRNLMDELRYQRRDDHNHLFISKRFTPQRG